VTALVAFNTNHSAQYGSRVLRWAFLYVCLFVCLSASISVIFVINYTACMRVIVTLYIVIIDSCICRYDEQIRRGWMSRHTRISTSGLGPVRLHYSYHSQEKMYVAKLHQLLCSCSCLSPWLGSSYFPALQMFMYSSVDSFPIMGHMAQTTRVSSNWLTRGQHVFILKLTYHDRSGVWCLRLLCFVSNNSSISMSFAFSH